jgi:hypothetical protein
VYADESDDADLATRMDSGDSSKAKNGVRQRLGSCQEWGARDSKKISRLQDLSAA